MMDANLVLQIAAATAKMQLTGGGISELAPEILTRLLGEPVWVAFEALRRQVGPVRLQFDQGTAPWSWIRVCERWA